MAVTLLCCCDRAVGSTDALGESAAHLESYVRVILGHTGTGASTGYAQATVVSAFAWTRTEEADPTAPDRRLPVAAAGGDGRRGTRRGTFAAPGSHGRRGLRSGDRAFAFDLSIRSP